MKKIILPVISLFICSAFYIVSDTGQQAPREKQYLGAEDAMGADDDANARMHYEWSMLADPATGKIPAHIREREMAFAATLPNDRYAAASRTTAGLNWAPRGPWNVGGRTRALGIDVSNPNNIVAGSCSGGMWRSTDRGASWHPTLAADKYKSVSCLTQDTRPGHTNVWYYGTGEAYGASASENGAYYLGNGIYKSTDSGATWTVLAATTSSSLTTFDVWADAVWNIAADPSDMANDVVYAAALGAIYRTSNGGTAWSPVLGSLGSSQFTDVAVTPSGIVYATLSSDGASRGIYRSTDGVTFTNITPPGFGINYNRVKIGICPDDETQVYFLANTPNSGLPDTNFLGQIEWNSLWKYNYVSGTGAGAGGTWRDLSQNLPATGGMFDKFYCQGSYDLVVKVKPGDSNTVFIGGTNLYRSTSGFADAAHTTYIGGYEEGATLPVVGMYLNHHPDQHDIAFFPDNPNKMISANDGGIFYTNDNTVPGVLWTSLNNGYITTMFYSCAIDHASNNDIIIGGAQDNGSWFTNSADVTHPWVTPRGGDGSFCAIADHGSSYYFSIQNGKTMRAKVDNSGRIDSFARIDPAGGRGYQFINPFAIDPNNNNIMYMAAGKFLWRNNNLSGIPYAANWDSISTNWFRFPDSTLTGGNYSISSVAVCKVPANRVYIGTSFRNIYRIDSANTSTHIYKNITSSLFPFTSSGSVPVNANCIAVDPENGDHIMVVFSNYGVYSLFYSSDAGATWQKAAGNLETNKTTGAGDGPSLRWASIIPVSGGSVYLVGTSVGLFATTRINDTNTVWVQQGTNTIGASVVDMIDYRATDGLVVVATHSGGIYSSHITSVGNITGFEEVAANDKPSFTTYPNPFTSETTIQFDLPAACKASLCIYDAMGRMVRVVANEQMSAGGHKYLFATNGLPAGIYYCSLNAGGYAQSLKLQVN